MDPDCGVRRMRIGHSKVVHYALYVDGRLVGPYCGVTPKVYKEWHEVDGYEPITCGHCEKHSVVARDQDKLQRWLEWAGER